MKEPTKLIDAFVLATQARVFKKKFKSLRANSSFEHIHTLRVNIRQMRSILWLYKKSNSEFRFRSLSHLLSKVSRQLGKVRTLDVAIQDSKKFRIRNKVLLKKRNLAEMSLQKMTSHKKRQQLNQKLLRALKKLESYPQSRLKAGVLELQARVRQWKYNKHQNPKELHRLRKIVKKTRYTLEAFARPVPSLEKLQEHLGRGHDFDALQTYLGKNKKVEQAAKRRYRLAQREKTLVLKSAIQNLNQIQKSIH